MSPKYRTIDAIAAIALSLLMLVFTREPTAIDLAIGWASIGYVIGVITGNIDSYFWRRKQIG